LRLLSYLPKDEPCGTFPVVSWGFPLKGEEPWLNSCPHPTNVSTGGTAGALTVAGQWRSFTAFPFILAIIVVTSLLESWRSSRDAMERTSMTSTFIVVIEREVKETGLACRRPATRFQV
jgi:hypothetical protein